LEIALCYKNSLSLERDEDDKHWCEARAPRRALSGWLARWYRSSRRRAWLMRRQSQKGGFAKTDAMYECVPVIIFTDLGTDLDDEMALLFARYLIEFDFIELLCVITCLHPSFKRAQLARGSLDMIGLHFVPVG
jgi:hypothetical protein